MKTVIGWHPSASAPKTITRFWMDEVGRGEYRIRNLVTNRFLHANGLGDRLVSSRYQDVDDFSVFRFIPARRAGCVILENNSRFDVWMTVSFMPNGRMDFGHSVVFRPGNVDRIEVPFEAVDIRVSVHGDSGPIDMFFYDGSPRDCIEVFGDRRRPRTAPCR